MTWKPDICIYHDNCNDGFGAAYAIWKKYGDEVKYVPRQYGMKPPDVAGKNVLMVDFSFKREMIDMMMFDARSIVVIDHHKTAEADLEHLHAIDLSETTVDDIEKNIADGIKGMAHFDMNMSGAALAWRFANPSDKYLPTIISYIQDRDLFKNKMTDTVEFNLALSSYAKDFIVWDIIANDRIDGLIEQGVAIRRHNDMLVGAISSSAAIRTFLGFGGVPVCNCPPMLASDVGNKLLRDNSSAPFSVCWSVAGDGINYSLRSENSREDVSKICSKYGGGGHRNAAGFRGPKI